MLAGNARVVEVKGVQPKGFASWVLCSTYSFWVSE